MKKELKKCCLVGINSKYIHPSMSIYTLYANTDYDLKLFEFNIKDSVDDMYNKIKDFDCIFLSVYIWNVEIIRELLSRLNDKIINIGGPEASFNKNLILEYKNNKVFITRGEGEESTNEFIAYINGDLPLSKVSNLYFLDSSGEEIYQTEYKTPDITKIKSSVNLIGDYENRVCYVESSRGCYYNCTYCLAATEKPVRYFTAEKIRTELLFLLEKKAKTIKFLDRSFNTRADFANRILNFIKEHDNGVSTFQFEANGDSIEPETIKILNSMRKNMVRLEIGIQSTNPNTIKAINRTQNLKKLKANILALKDNCVIHTDLIAGLPYEDYDSFKNSFNETFLLFTDELQLGFLKELKGTVLSKTKSIYGYKFQESAPFEVIENEYISSSELNKIRKVEISVNKFYNYKIFNKTMKYIFIDKKLDPFDTFLNLTLYLEKTKPVNEYQFDELTSAFYDFLSKKIRSKDELLFIIKDDYLTKNRIKPKIWWKKDISREERLDVYKLFAQKYDLNIDTLFNYGLLEKWNNKYLLIDYKNFKKYYLEKN